MDYTKQNNISLQSALNFMKAKAADGEDKYSVKVVAVWGDHREDSELAQATQNPTEITNAIKMAEAGGAAEIHLRCYNTRTAGGKNYTNHIRYYSEIEPNETSAEDVAKREAQEVREILKEQGRKINEITTTQLGSTEAANLQQVNFDHQAAIQGIETRMEINGYVKDIIGLKKEISDLEEENKDLVTEIEGLEEKIAKGVKLEDGVSKALAAAEMAFRMNPKLVVAADNMGLGTLARALAADSPEAAAGQPPDATTPAAIHVDENSVKHVELVVSYLQSLDAESQQKFAEIVQQLKQDEGSLNRLYVGFKNI